jgi:hypothetical protein
MPSMLLATTFARMQPSFSSAWILFVLPFASSGVIAHARPLRRLSTRHNKLTMTVGLLGLGAFVSGMVGLLPVSWAILAVVAGGALAGFSIFSIPPKQKGGGEEDSDDGGWGRRPPPEDEPPPPAGGGGELDWEQFDRVRAQWEQLDRTPVGTGS